MLPVLLPVSDSALDALARRAAETNLAAVAPKAKSEDLGVAVGVVDRATGTVRWGSFNGDRTHYPASTVKLFWLAYAERRIEDGKLKTTSEVLRGLHDMIVDSTNDATALIVDAATETTGGPELSAKALKSWMAKRQAANRWFSGMGYTGINACQKTWNEAPYGRERQGYGPKFELRNAMSPMAGMRLLSEIMLDRIVNPAACGRMRDLLHRTNPLETQIAGFSGSQMGPGCEIWSKAGWTDSVKCDIAWIKAPDGREIVLSIFTADSAREETLVQKIARDLLMGLKMPVKA